MRCIWAMPSLLVLILSLPAHAQEDVRFHAPSLPEVPASAPTFPVELSCTKPDVLFDVVQNDAVIETCLGDCRINLAPGKYKMVLHEGSETDAGERKFAVPGSTSVRVVPERKGRRGASVTLAVTGTAIAGAGLLAIMGAVLSAGCYGGDSCSPDTPEEKRALEKSQNEAKIVALVGAGLLVVGGTLATIGWINFGDARRPDLAVGRRRATGFSARLVPIERGASLSGRFSF